MDPGFERTGLEKTVCWQVMHALVQLLRVDRDAELHDCRLFPRELSNCLVQRTSDCPPLDGADLLRKHLPGKPSAGGGGDPNKALANEYSWGR